MKFKVGDKVKIVKCMWDNPYHIGKVGIFEEMNHSYSPRFDVNLSTDDVCVATKIEPYIEKRGRPKKSKIGTGKVKSKKEAITEPIHKWMANEPSYLKELSWAPKLPPLNVPVLNQKSTELTLLKYKASEITLEEALEELE